MSRFSNSRRAKRLERFPQSSVLIVGEGQTEEVFLKHLKRIYESRATITNGYGGSPSSVLQKAKNQFPKNSNIFDDKVLLLDGDVTPPARFDADCQTHGYEVVTTDSVCIECFLLDLLGLAKGTVNSCADCKRKLKNHMGYTNMSNFSQKLPLFFSKSKLETTRSSNSTLDKIIKLLEK
ncbi:hypothetical protein PQO01_20170 [Lentisphaera marina]|uniref:RloB domain-containing protein n=1 Tax=Lentisphaera marina TaxID=1111041 RepID=UPI002366483F|nr:RloB domain-containing protein [Lentisphaera marina]MDD7987276.1 hypothetical protein [Lentisphaera marina]